MSKTLLATILALGITVVSSTVMGFELGQSRQGRGADDPAGHIRQGRGADDPVGHISGRDRVRNNSGLSYGNNGRGHGMGAVGTTNPSGNERGRGRGRGRGGDEPTGYIGGGRGANNAVKEVRGTHTDGYISGRDRVRFGGMGAVGLVGR